MPMSVNYAYAYKYYASDMTGTPRVRIFFWPSTSTGGVKNHDRMTRTNTIITSSVFFQQPSQWPRHGATIPAQVLFAC